MQELRYELTADDFVDANAAHLRSSRVRYLFMVIGYPSLAVAVYAWIAEGRVAVFNLFFGLFFVGLPVLMRVSARAGFKKQPSLSQPVAVKVGSEGLRIDSAQFSGDDRWDLYVAYLETSRQFLLYLGPRLFRSIPKRAFGSEAEVETFRKLITQRIGRVRAEWLF